MANKLRVGVVGVGSLGQWHARIYSGLDSTELVGVYDTNRARAEEIAARYGTQAFPSLRELAAAIEAASVVTPTDRHFEVFNELAASGLHQLVEKPIASSTEQAERMAALAREKGLILQVGHVERFNPVMKFLEERLARPRFIEAIRLAPFPPPREGALPRGAEVSVVLDLMIHDLEIILHLVRSPVKSINAVGVPVLTAGEDIANVRLGFENGCIANVTASRISLKKLRQIRVFQEDTYLSLDYMDQSGQLCRKSRSGIETAKVPIEKDEPLKAELASFVNCVLTRNDPVVSGQHASEALKLAVRISQALRHTPS
ncbi:MAG: Gfo/Idh/MocA family oxidoreductase [Verrucomicrobiota bacterium]|nr:Gfo/Idh/MocA family oxidoreductase [Verrucomicrobiota bacterium]